MRDRDVVKEREKAVKSSKNIDVNEKKAVKSSKILLQEKETRKSSKKQLM